MSDFMGTLKKMGGVSLLREFRKEGVLIYAALQMLLLGRSKPALHLLRKGISIKLRAKLVKQYSKVIDAFDKDLKTKEFVKLRSNKVWFCWFQGLDNAPALVKKCYESLKKNLVSKEIVLLTSDNYKQYAPNIPDYIIEKYEKGLITHTHFSDILRIELLAEHGGTWIDATVFCSGKNIPDYMLDSDFFVFQNLKPGANGSVNTISSWFITSCSNNEIILCTRELLRKYWKKNNRLVNYYLIHHFVCMSINKYRTEFERMTIAFPNSFPHVLLLMLFEPFDQRKWDAVVSACPFHKLAYKRSKEEMELEGTYFKHIMAE
jgi:hypothetical protein